MSICTDQPEYKLCLAQSLFKAGLYEAAQKVCANCTSPQTAPQVIKLDSSILYELGDFEGCRVLVDQSDQKDSLEKLSNMACLLLKEVKPADASKMYMQASKIVGFRADLVYHTALCNYQLKEYGHSLSLIADIIERGIREHPELGIGLSSDNVETKSVGNSQNI